MKKLPFWSESLNKQELLKLDPKKLEVIGRKHGVELDRRYKKTTLVDVLYTAIKEEVF